MEKFEYVPPPPSTDYRDRVDMMAAAILSGQWANHAVMTPPWSLNAEKDAGLRK